MARPDPNDVALCIEAALNPEAYRVTVEAMRSHGYAARRVMCDLVDHPYYGGKPQIRDMTNALGHRYGEWVSGSNQENCAMALALFKEHYPEG